MASMSDYVSEDHHASDGRRAAHVKWDGKTIALGTFSASEAAEKCNRAKALTKKWRTTMVPKPDVEWVKKALERLNIRVVNDRPGRRKKRDINQLEQHSQGHGHGHGGHGATTNLDHHHSSLDSNALLAGFQQQSHLPRNSMNINASNLSSYANTYGQATNSNPYSSMVGGVADVSSSMERRFSNPSQRRFDNQHASSIYTNPLAQAQNGYDLSSMQDYQTAAAAANLTSSHEHHSRVQGTTTGQGGLSSTQQQLSNLVFGSHKHYEVLKEHHLNLLQELQETTLLMNMYHQNDPRGGGINVSRTAAGGASAGGIGMNQDSLDPTAGLGVASSSMYFNQQQGAAASTDHHNPARRSLSPLGYENMRNRRRSNAATTMANHSSYDLHDQHSSAMGFGASGFHGASSLSGTRPNAASSSLMNQANLSMNSSRSQHYQHAMAQSREMDKNCEQSSIPSLTANATRSGESIEELPNNDNAVKDAHMKGEIESREV